MATPLTKSLPSGLAQVEQDIARACKEARRERASVTLIAVSKTFEATAISPVIDAGQRVFGENRVQEAMGRWGERRGEIELRLIGPLQSNKAREAVGFFDVIESLDREKLARVLADEIQAQGKAPRLFIQVNTGQEPQKAGVAPGQADAFVARCRGLDLPVEGLMCIPPADADPAPHFRLLGQIAARNGLEKLSMGMSDDFEAAIACGATSVRIGSALFGSRR